MKLKILLTLLLITGLFLRTSTALADFELPAFDSCYNPKGSVQADYPTGLHAIVGVMGVQNGSDKVFFNGDDNYTQCYCPDSETSGIKTDWLAAGTISKADQNVLLTQGWVYIANGADWGLSSQPYLAKNTEFSCSGGSASDNGESSDNGNGGGSSTSGSSNGTGGGEVLGISTLAGTSSSYTKYEVFLTILLASLSILYGYKIQKNQP